VRMREAIKALVNLGRVRGFVCPADVASLLPPEELDPTGLTQLLLVLESCHIELVDNDEADRRRPDTSKATTTRQAWHRT